MPQLITPPKVLPTVATAMAGQNNSGLSWIRPNTTGSEPSGSRVAETRETTKTKGKPLCGSDNQSSNSVM